MLLRPGTGRADTIDQAMSFTGEITASCVINVMTSGQLGVSADHLKMSSKEIGGVSGVAEITTNITGSQIQIVNPSAFTVAPSGADTGSLFSTEYTLTGVTMGTMADGAVATTLLPGVTAMTLNVEAARSDTLYPVGNYTLSPTVRCITP
ncbi:hypothetical protein [uncultured Algimonas sp.]|uniref:hypothetical protein n=1 Tax=uncultured Algimonas sp. TaxID=1547920 RepID=UPI002636C720|nr:hypothetical protein [uncultured Algimonas sp.]